MKLTFKIWAGVFIAIMCAYVGFEMSEWFAESHARHERMAGLSLTPDTLIEKCGRPLKDESDESSEIEIRDIYYSCAVPGKRSFCVVDFRKMGSGDWTYYGFGYGNLEMGDVGWRSPVEESDPQEQIRMLPCLARY